MTLERLEAAVTGDVAHLSLYSPVKTADHKQRKKMPLVMGDKAGVQSILVSAKGKVHCAGFDLSKCHIRDPGQRCAQGQTKALSTLQSGVEPVVVFRDMRPPAFNP